jgi:hypothetical protein
MKRRRKRVYLYALMIGGNTVMAVWNLNGMLRGVDDGL